MNIFEIEQELISIFDEIEEMGGEITPEIEEKLSITQETFKDKIESYTKVITMLTGDTKTIKDEINRLKTLSDRKEKTIESLKTVIIKAINEFGDTKKTGVKYIDYGTGEVSIRKSQAVQVNDKLVNDIGKYVNQLITFNKIYNQLDTYNDIDKQELKRYINDTYEIDLTDEDLNNVDISMSVDIPLKEFIDGFGYNKIKEIIKCTDSYKFNANVSKTKVKEQLKENSSCMPNIAMLVNNQSLTMK